MSERREVLETWFRRVWNEENADAIDELFVVDGQARGLGANPLIGPKDFKQFHTTLRGLLRDFDITIDKSIEEGEWISAICSLRAKSRNTGIAIEMTGSVMIRIANGRLMEAYNHWDFLGLFAQLGLLPAQTFQQALSGNKIV